MKTPAIAVVLNDRDVLSLNKNLLKEVDLIELRVDMFENIDRVEEIFAIAKEKFGVPLLCTVRAPEEGGKKKFDNRLNIYEKVMPYCDFFDIEIFAEEAKALRQLSKQNNIKLILSYHRFDLTPSEHELEGIFEIGKKLNGDIIKIATMINTKEDVETLTFFLLRHKNDKVIVIGMGENGKITRILFPFFGSLITYASLNLSSAPGQIALQDMINIFKKIGLTDKKR
ncbi:MAG: type I 3-dehydroquinate dehydratase [Thermodesulfovibrio sp.]